MASEDALAVGERRAALFEGFLTLLPDCPPEHDTSGGVLDANRRAICSSCAWTFAEGLGRAETEGQP